MNQELKKDIESSSSIRRQSLLNDNIKLILDEIWKFHAHVSLSGNLCMVNAWSELLESGAKKYSLQLLRNALIRPSKGIKWTNPISSYQDLATDTGVAVLTSKAQMIAEPLTRMIGVRACKKKNICLEEIYINKFFRDSTTASRRGDILEKIIYLRYLQYGPAPLSLLPGWPTEYEPLRRYPPHILVSEVHLGPDIMEKRSDKDYSVAFIPHKDAGPDLADFIFHEKIDSILFSLKLRTAEKGFDPCVTRGECAKAVRTTDPNKFYHQQKGFYATYLPKKKELAIRAEEAQQCVSRWKGKSIRIRVELPCADDYFAPKNDKVVQISYDWNDFLKEQKTVEKNAEKQECKEKKVDILKQKNKRKRITCERRKKKRRKILK